MPDDKEPEQDFTIPESMVFDNAIANLTSTLHPEHDGWNQGGRRVPLKGREENGVWVVTYRLDQPECFLDHCKWADNTRILSKEDGEHDVVLDVFAQIEEVTNIKFREAINDESTDISYFKGDMFNETTAAYIKYRFTHDGLPDEVVVSEERPKQANYLIHETLHALGLSHPGSDGSSYRSGGYNPAFNQDDTVMSYNMGTADPGLAAFDVAALQYIYGKPKSQNGPTIIDGETLEDRLYLDTRQPATLDLRDSVHASGILNIDMGKKITGVLISEDGEEADQVHMRFTEGSELKNVLMRDNTGIQLDATGNNLPNHIQGGLMPDEITPRGGSDILSGRANSEGDFYIGDRFIMDKKSGFNNIITDFTTNGDNADEIKFGSAFNKVELAYREDYPFEGPKKGTLVTGKGANDKLIASVFVIDATPADLVDKVGRSLEYVVSAIKSNERLAKPVVVITANVPQAVVTTTAHPSGLPASVGSAAEQNDAGRSGP